VIFDGGQEGTVAGTSCSSPIFASTIALLNAELIAAGKPTMGFLNPFIYANPGVFTDITTGSNPGCNTNGFPVCNCVVYAQLNIERCPLQALAGWDPVRYEIIFFARQRLIIHSVVGHRIRYSKIRVVEDGGWIVMGVFTDWL
jgi:hypothetical protein